MSSIIYSDILRSVYHSMTDGKKYETDDLVPLVKKACGYSDEQMKEMTQGDTSPRVRKYISWALTHLCGAGLIYRVKRGVYEIVPSRSTLLSMEGKELESLVRGLANSRKKNNTSNVDIQNQGQQSFRILSSDDDILDYSISSIGFLSDKPQSDNEVRNTILISLFDAEYNKERFGMEYNLEEILECFKAERTKEYRLEIVPEKVVGKKGGHKIPYIDCHIYITDENDKKKEIILKQQEKAVYLMFLLHREGIYINEFPKTEDEIAHKKKYETHLKLYSKIQSKLLDNNYIEKPQLLQGDITPIRTKIKNKLLEITPNRKYIEMFAIEGYKEKAFKVCAATDEQRKMILDAFGIDIKEYGLN